MSGPDWNRHQVERFYTELWDAHDMTSIGEILHEDFTFRGSLGAGKRGHAGFAEYVDGVHAALGDYRCIIEDLIAEGDRVVARMTFRGVHRGPLLGVAPTGRSVHWAGAAFFTFRDGRVADLWVLGDLNALESRLT